MIKYSIPVIVAMFANPVFAQHVHETPNHPVETGQSAFAAISEIVEILSNDPKTDWETIDVQALREHLRDMELVTTEASVAIQVEGNSVEFTVFGAGDVEQAVQRMTLAHAPMLQAASGWLVTSQPSNDGAIMRVEVQTDEDLARVVALGFFGIMTIGAHHQAHHLEIASGNDPHHHH
ncbi:hypothetical protein [Cognatishimia activa]|uniref:hypothetical protein n=1 Tax=Cognatishimia activa TaxID=1715691 RepID=UPI0022312876|nr:hypothetical protein [Cognatishimia activa]UZD90832.1 hypothetical protein M0D42_14790 [Cognatishimia activa]